MNGIGMIYLCMLPNSSCVQSSKLLERWTEVRQNIHQGKSYINDRLGTFRPLETGSKVVNNAPGTGPGRGF